MNAARLFVSFTAAVLALGAGGAAMRADPPADPAAALLAAHNRERKKEGRSALVLSTKLCAAAAVHAKDMAAHQKLSHPGSAGSTSNPMAASLRNSRAPRRGR